jgi:hypothetical protein
MLMYLKHRIATLATGPLGDARHETLEAGEAVMPVGLPESGWVDAMTMAGLIRVRVEHLTSSPAAEAKDRSRNQ